MSDNSSQSAALPSKRLGTAVPTAEEYALLREAYAETYPVRPLLNAIDAKDAEIKLLCTAGVIEVAVRNPSVADYMNHWEGRATKAEAEVERLRRRMWKYGKHLTACRLQQDQRQWCDCGWDKIRETLAGEAQRPADETIPAQPADPHYPNVLKEITSEWAHEKNDMCITVHHRMVGGVLCRWWGDGPTPEGVGLIDRAAENGTSERV